MKFIRSVRCSLKFTSKSKKEELRTVLKEYGCVVNLFIDRFWDNCPKKKDLLKGVIVVEDTWLSARLCKVAARQAIDMVQSSLMKKKQGGKPTHSYGMSCSSNTANLSVSRVSEFDYWLHLHSLGNKIIIDLPIKAHKQFNRWLIEGRRLNSYVITDEYVQFCFEMEVDQKKEPINTIGIDTGIKRLATLSNGDVYGDDIEDIITRINRCKHGSKRQKRLRNFLKQYMDKIAKTIVSKYDLIVVEKLKDMNYKTKVKRRLNKNMRRTIGSWNYRHWLDRLLKNCEENRVSFRSVGAYYTSQECRECGHTDRRNRLTQSVFCCQSCGHTDNADLNAARNILNRFITGAYGPGCKRI